MRQLLAVVALVGGALGRPLAKRHWHRYNRYWGADYNGRHLFQCRCGHITEGI